MAELQLILKYRLRNKAAVHEPTVTNANSYMNHAQSRYINHPVEKYFGYSIREIQPCQVVKAFFYLSTILSPGSAAGAAALKYVPNLINLKDFHPTSQSPLRQSALVHRKAVVLRGDVTPLRSQVHHRLVHATISKTRFLHGSHLMQGENRRPMYVI